MFYFCVNSQAGRYKEMAGGIHIFTAVWVVLSFSTTSISLSLSLSNSFLSLLYTHA